MRPRHLWAVLAALLLLVCGAAAVRTALRASATAEPAHPTKVEVTVVSHPPSSANARTTVETKGQSTRVAQKQVRTTSRSSTTGSSAAPVWSSTRSLSARGNAEAHWAKHREEFPEYRSADEYIAGARAFFGKPPPGTLTKVRPNGDRLFYNPRSNTFGVQARDGAPRTMFRPTAGMEYWNRQ